MSSLLLKTVHISCAASSYILFFLRGIWSLNGSTIMRQRWIKIVPHVVDAWLTTKVIALLLYIGLGFVALRYGRSKTVRLSAWIMAQLVFTYIVLVAISRNPWPFGS